MLHFVQTDDNKVMLHKFIDLFKDKGVLLDYPLPFTIMDTQKIVHYSVEALTIPLEDEKIVFSL